MNDQPLLFYWLYESNMDDFHQPVIDTKSYLPLKTGDYDEPTESGPDEESDENDDTDQIRINLSSDSDSLDILESSIKRLSQLSLHIAEELDQQASKSGFLQMEVDTLSEREVEITRHTRYAQRESEFYDRICKGILLILAIIATILFVLVLVKYYHRLNS